MPWRRGRAATATRCCSARMTRSASRSSGRAFTAWMMTWACSTRRSPWARASRTWSWVPRSYPSRTTPAAAGRVILVWCASQFAVEVAPSVVADLQLVGVRRDPGPELLDDLGLQPGQLDQRGGGLSGVHGPHRRVHQAVGDAAQLRGRRGHLVAGCGHRCHEPSQPAPTTPRIRVATTGGERCRKPCCGRQVGRLVVVSRLRPGGLRTSTTGSAARRPGGRVDPSPAVPALSACRRPTRADLQEALIALPTLRRFRDRR